MSRLGPERSERRDGYSFKPSGVNPCRPASAGRQFHFQFRGFADVTFYLAIIASHPIGVDSVLVGDHREVSVGQEGEINFELARSPVCHRTHVPVFTITAGDDY